MSFFPTQSPILSEVSDAGLYQAYVDAEPSSQRLLSGLYAAIPDIARRWEEIGRMKRRCGWKDLLALLDVSPEADLLLHGLDDEMATCDRLSLAEEQAAQDYCTAYLAAYRLVTRMALDALDPRKAENVLDDGRIALALLGSSGFEADHQRASAEWLEWRIRIWMARAMIARGRDVRGAKRTALEARVFTSSHNSHHIHMTTLTDLALLEAALLDAEFKKEEASVKIEEAAALARVMNDPETTAEVTMERAYRAEDPERAQEWLASAYRTLPIGIRRDRIQEAMKAYAATAVVATAKRARSSGAS